MNTSVLNLMDWPDTTRDEPPADWLYKSATWLLGRHRMLAELAARCPGVVEREDGELGINQDLLTGGLWAWEDWMTARNEYARQHSEPDDDVRWEAWDAASPQCPDTPVGKVAYEFAHMSGSERTRLRLLAAFSHPGARINVSDFGRMDASGQDLLRDWMTAALAA